VRKAKKERVRTNMKFYIADVFGVEKYSGNQLAVVVPDEILSVSKMQQIANEFHFSETTFVSMKNSKANEFSVNIFTPKNEVPFAGHPTLGTAFIIKNEIVREKINEIFLNLKVGKIPVLFDDKYELQWMSQIEPTFGSIHNPEEVAGIIGLSSGEIDTQFPIQNVSTGIEFLLIPLKRLNSVKLASTNLAKYKEYFQKSEPKPLFVFCPETYEAANKINCRMFADVFGIPEDPATGSANGCLAAYLAKYNYLKTNQIEIKVEQGYEIGRKSILHLRSSYENGKYHIKVGGKVIKVAEGILV
jgi:trans-2,3-dihydro-3-hydroxyanthranilate isomerase